MASRQSFGTSPFSLTSDITACITTEMWSPPKQKISERSLSLPDALPRFSLLMDVSTSSNVAKSFSESTLGFVVSFQELQGLLGISCLTAPKNVLSTCWRFFPLIMDFFAIFRSQWGDSGCFRSERLFHQVIEFLAVFHVCGSLHFCCKVGPPGILHGAQFA